MNSKRAFTTQSLRPQRLVVASLALALLAASVATDSQAVEDEELFYHLGTVMGNSLSDFQLSEDELKVVQKAISDVVKGKDVGEATEEHGIFPRTTSFTTRPLSAISKFLDLPELLRYSP